ncbi:thiol:disulfide interchange protein DsbA/DsbL [Glaesserella parasuis]|uniref:thiol:disulfide interchange protein DsbA/DsbL n=1 Tax=Glaesserella parasuis TaxID=738 RepID=UPI00243711CA|nr:thiol:disulfide interchange protein DsbA/DsbL [Glaesserella parasuis]MDG6447891.1 thiol:disulfide interchange protein DsbA/DsbL [Glaesserella parasuis]MDG6475558.1 thiol:disulfide interchange protein DsbA/DsbL [Glaesserella parasuis]
MKLTRYLTLVTTLLCATSLLAVTPEKEALFKEGKAYHAYEKPLDIPLPKGKVLITYFYQYACEICLNADDHIKKFVARNGDKVVLQRIAIATEDNTISPKLNAIFEELGQEDLSALFLFDSAYKGKDFINSNNDIAKWLENHKVSIEQIEQIYKKESYQQRLKTRKETVEKYSPLMGMPLLVVNGKYYLTRSTLYNDDYTYAVLDFLVDKLQKEQQGVTK